MKHLADYLAQKMPAVQVVDEKTLFYVFERYIESAYGHRGRQSIMPRYYKNKTLHITATSALWAHEVWMHRTRIVKALQDEVGREYITKITVKGG